MTGKDSDHAERGAGSSTLYCLAAQELAELAKSHELETLAYILDMARLEADQICKRGQGPKALAG